jgi:hypothetical protein
MIKSVYMSSCKVPDILVRFYGCLEFAQISNIMKIRTVGKELSHADRRTDMAKLIVAFRNFAAKAQ